MSGKPRADRASVRTRHLGIRLTEQEFSWLQSIVDRGNAHRAKLARFGKPSVITPTDVIRSLITMEHQDPRMQEDDEQLTQHAWMQLDHLVEAANTKVTVRKGIRAAWADMTRLRMIRKLIDEEYKRRGFGEQAEPEGSG